MKALASISVAVVVAVFASCAAASAADVALTYRPHYREPLPAPVVVRGPVYDYPRYRVVIIDHSHDTPCEDTYDIDEHCSYQGSF